MEALSRILKQVKVTTSQTSTQTNFSCKQCKDTGWIEISNRTYKECKCVVQAKSKNQWESFNLKPENVKKLNEYIPYDKLTERAKSKAIQYVNNFDISNAEWMCLMGQPGSGKSHIVIAIGAALLSKGYKVVYMPYVEVMKEIKASANNLEEYAKLTQKYLNADVLIVDDLFKDKVKNGQLISELTEVDLKHIYPILNSRYNNNLITIISTECTPIMLMDLDEALGGRILEKSMNNSTVFEDRKYNYRVRQFTQKGE